MIPSNYHTHTVFCDGKDTPEELVQEAIRLGCPELGFSGHSFTPFDQGCCMSREGTLEYCRTVQALQAKYADKIRILLGLELDYFSEKPDFAFDYLIGSVHYIYKDGQYLSVDESPESFAAACEAHYCGDYYAFCEDYYRLVGDVYRKTGCQIVGHFDLITKFNEGNRLFDTRHPRYVAAVLSALEVLRNAPVTFEINTGAMARGYRSEPYPESWILEILLRNGMQLITNSDCHDKRNLLFGLT